MLNLRLVRAADRDRRHRRRWPSCEQAERRDGELVPRRVRYPCRHRGRPHARRHARARCAVSLRNIAYRAVRNRGTIGGSLSHADPAADWVSALSALGAATDAAQARRCAHGIAIEDSLSARSDPRAAPLARSSRRSMSLCDAGHRRAGGYCQGLPQDRRVRACDRGRHDRCASAATNAPCRCSARIDTAPIVLDQCAHRAVRRSHLPATTSGASTHGSRTRLLAQNRHRPTRPHRHDRCQRAAERAVHGAAA